MKLSPLQITGLVFTLIGTVLCVCFIVWLYWTLQPVSSTPVAGQRIIIKKGSGVAQVASLLEEKGLIKNKYVFRIYARLQQLDTKIQAGSYTLSAQQSLPELALKLTQGTEDTWITLLEGWRREEIAEYLNSQENLTSFDAEEFLTLSAASEGMLFPDTYLIPNESTAKTVYDLLTRTFEKKFVDAYALQIANSGKKVPELVTFASLIQREAKSFSDMRHVAGILKNRMRLGMPLQVDATLQYVRGYDEVKKTWWSPPLVEFKKTQSPYNTYLTLGLPPHAIANPGLEALRAALDPLPTDDVFYIHAPSGVMYYAETLEEHNQNVARYLR